jgi:hypothetical protein
MDSLRRFRAQRLFLYESNGLSDGLVSGVARFNVHVLLSLPQGGEAEVS